MDERRSAHRPEVSMKRNLILLSIPLLFALPPVARSQCAGFSDVPAASTFCENVHWVKNREITLGCTSTTLYCPTDPVLRLSMAAFLNRLGRALTPRFVFETDSVPGPDDTAFVFGCISEEITPAFAQQGVVIGSVYFFPSGGPVSVTVRIAYSTDGGASWSSAALASNGGDARWPGSGNAGQYTLMAVNGSAVPMQPGTGYRFAVGLNKTGGMGSIPTMSCRTTLMIHNRNPDSAPF
jgi:hypothetical protein